MVFVIFNPKELDEQINKLKSDKLVVEPKYMLAEEEKLERTSWQA